MASTTEDRWTESNPWIICQSVNDAARAYHEAALKDNKDCSLVNVTEEDETEEASAEKSPSSVT